MQAGETGGSESRGAREVCLNNTVQVKPQRVQGLQGASHQDTNWDENAKADHHKNTMNLCTRTFQFCDRKVAAHCTSTARKVPAHYTSAHRQVPAHYTSADRKVPSHRTSADSKQPAHCTIDRATSFFQTDVIRFVHINLALSRCVDDKPIKSRLCNLTEKPPAHSEWTWSRLCQSQQEDNTGKPMSMSNHNSTLYMRGRQSLLSGLKQLVASVHTWLGRESAHSASKPTQQHADSLTNR